MIFKDKNWKEIKIWTKVKNIKLNKIFTFSDEHKKVHNFFNCPEKDKETIILDRLIIL